MREISAVFRACWFCATVIALPSALDCGRTDLELQNVVGGRSDAGLACVPASCADVGVDCGSLSDGCGGRIFCGTCAAPSTCGAGTPNQCGCPPTTCADSQADCGDLFDGCDAVLACGECAAGQTCGARGPNRCGTGSCAPRSCRDSAVECGRVSDGCGSVLACGTCGAPETCGGGGVANRCGCTPGTCADVGATCGSLSDGCGSSARLRIVRASPVLRRDPSQPVRMRTDHVRRGGRSLWHDRRRLRRNAGVRFVPAAHGVHRQRPGQLLGRRGILSTDHLRQAGRGMRESR